MSQGWCPASLIRAVCSPLDWSWCLRSLFAPLASRPGAPLLLQMRGSSGWSRWAQLWATPVPRPPGPLNAKQPLGHGRGAGPAHVPGASPAVGAERAWGLRSRKSGRSPTEAKPAAPLRLCGDGPAGVPVIPLMCCFLPWEENLNLLGKYVPVPPEHGGGGLWETARLLVRRLALEVWEHIPSWGRSPPQRHGNKAETRLCGAGPRYRYRQPDGMDLMWNLQPVVPPWPGASPPSSSPPHSSLHGCPRNGLSCRSLGLSPNVTSWDRPSLTPLAGAPFMKPGPMKAMLRGQIDNDPTRLQVL